MILAFLLFINSYVSFAEDISPIKIAAFVEDKGSQSQLPIRNAIWLNQFRQRNQVDVDVEEFKKNDFYQNVKKLCEKISNEAPVAIFGGESAVSPIFQSVSTHLNIPYIQTNWQHYGSYKGGETSINFYPDPDLLAQALAIILRSLAWEGFIILYETDDGLIRLQEILKYEENDKDNVLEGVMVRQLVPGEDHRTILKEVRAMKENQVILDCEAKHLADILQEAKDVGMLEYYHDYFLTSFDANTIDLSFLETEANITTISLINHKDEQVKGIVQDWELNEFRKGKPMSIGPLMIEIETALIHDSMNILLEVLNNMPENLGASGLSCGGPNTFEYGTEIISAMKSTTINSLLTGPMEFDEMGRRTNFTIYVIDWSNKLRIATWNAHDPYNIQIHQTIYEKIIAYLERTRKRDFVVSTRFMEPYFMMKTPKDGEVLIKNDRYEGYIVDLIEEISAIVNYSFVFKPNKDNKYGSFNPETEEYDGIIGDVIDYVADFGVADLTITPARREVVDFSSPFMRLGIGLILKDLAAEDKTWAFLQPLTKDVWFYSATVFLIMSIVLWFVARLAPGDWENPDARNRRPPELENIWNFKNCFWIMLGTITNQGCDIYPKGVSSRMATSMWWFFALIITNSYIANLASFLTTELQTEVSTVEELASQTKIKYGCMRNSSTQYFFKSSNYAPFRKIHSTMILTRPDVFVDSTDDGVKRVQNSKNGDYAFFMESTQIEYIIETKCDLKTLDVWLYPKEYGIAMQLNSPHRKKINDAILRLEGDGKLMKLKTKWWKEMRKEPSCPTKKKPGADMDISDISGVFIVLGAGCGVAVLVGIIDFLWNVRNVSISQHITLKQACKLELISSSKMWRNTKKITGSEKTPRGSLQEEKNDKNCIPLKTEKKSTK